MAEAFDWADPASPDISDGGQDYNLGIRWTYALQGRVTGTRWTAPTTADDVTNVATLWRVSDQQLLASKTFVPTNGAEQDIMFDTPVDIEADELYASAIYLNRFAITAVGPFPVTQGNLTAGADNGWLHVGGAGGAFPEIESSGGSNYFVSPIVEELTAVTGALDVTLPALTAELVGEASADGALAVTLPALAASLAGRAFVDGALAATLPALTASMAGGVSASGAVAAVLPALTGSLTGTAAASGSASLALPALTATFAGFLGIPGTTTLRPNTGITARPFTGTTPRP